jgi:hypothetical protein
MEENEDKYVVRETTEYEPITNINVITLGDVRAGDILIDENNLLCRVVSSDSDARSRSWMIELEKQNPEDSGECNAMISGLSSTPLEDWAGGRYSLYETNSNTLDEFKISDLRVGDILLDGDRIMCRVVSSGAIPRAPESWRITLEGVNSYSEGHCSTITSSDSMLLRDWEGGKYTLE